MKFLGVKWQCETGAPPTDMVSLAADAGCSHISTLLRQAAYNPFGYPAWSLADDPALRRAR